MGKRALYLQYKALYNTFKSTNNIFVIQTPKSLYNTFIRILLFLTLLLKSITKTVFFDFPKKILRPEVPKRMRGGVFQTYRVHLW